MFDLLNVKISPQCHHFKLYNDDQPVSYQSVLKLWQTDRDFTLWFSEQLAKSSFEAFRWETPVLTRGKQSRDFEFVLIDAPRFVSRATNRDAFSTYFNQRPIVSFPNLGGDGLMIVPCPEVEDDIYGHLASVLRLAPKAQIIALWKEVGAQVELSLDDNPKWLNTAGGGVAWLHVRLDSRPKYYHYTPYRDVNFV